MNCDLLKIANPEVFKLGMCIVNIQDDSVARGPKLLSIKNYVIEIMT